MSRIIIGPQRPQPPLPPIPNTVAAPRRVQPSLPASSTLPRVEVVEPWDDAHWNKPGSFGRRIEIESPAQPNVAIPIFENTKFPGPPRARMVHLFRSDRNLSVFANGDFRCRLTYGNSGIVNEMLLDWTQGVQFPLVCQSLRIDAVSYAPSSLAPYAVNTGPIVLGALVSLDGVGGKCGCPTFTTPIRALALPAPNAFFEQVPDLARVVHPMLADLGAAIVYAEYRLRLRGATTVLADYALDTAATIQQGYVLPGACSSVQLTKTAGATPVQASLCFSLGF